VELRSNPSQVDTPASAPPTPLQFIWGFLSLPGLESQSVRTAVLWEGPMPGAPPSPEMKSPAGAPLGGLSLLGSVESPRSKGEGTALEHSAIGGSFPCLPTQRLVWLHFFTLWFLLLQGSQSPLLVQEVRKGESEAGVPLGKRLKTGAVICSLLVQKVRKEGSHYSCST
jgi:hypothetical protein